MNFAEIKQCDIANGPGARTTLFVSGCTHACPGCFNPEVQSFAYGREFTDEDADKLIESLKPVYVTGLTLLGGEPMEPANQVVLADLLERVRAELPEKTVWCYTGDVYEELADPANPRHGEATERMFACIDVLVDGPFVQALKDITLRFRGSSNQRLIDLKATRAAGEVVLWEDEAVYASHSWD